MVVEYRILRRYFFNVGVTPFPIAGRSDPEPEGSVPCRLRASAAAPVPRGDRDGGASCPP